MRYLGTMVPLMCFVGVATVATADPVIDCSHRSLADVVENVLVKDIVIMFTGVCNGPIVIGADGITLQGVSGAHLVSFGGTINSSGNPVAGVSVNSKAGLDLDAASQLNSFDNGDGFLMQDDSVVTVFNTPQFSGAQGFSTINSHNNTRSGVRVLTGSTLTLVNQARVISTQNTSVGLGADNGAGLTLVNSTLTANTGSDLQLTFGTRADLRTLTFGTYTCDATVLVRGTSGIVCPH